MEENYRFDPSNNSVEDDFNFTYEFDPKLMERYITNKKIDEPAYTTLIVMYCILIAFGALGNILVVSSMFLTILFLQKQLWFLIFEIGWAHWEISIENVEVSYSVPVSSGIIFSYIARL